SACTRRYRTPPAGGARFLPRGAAACRGAAFGAAHGPHLPATSSSAEEQIAAIGLEPRNAHAGRHVEPPVRGSTRRKSLWSPSQVPCYSSPSIQVTPVTKRLDSMVRSITPVWGSI